MLGFPCAADNKEIACNVGDLGSIPGLERSVGEFTLNVFIWLSLDLPGSSDGKACACNVGDLGSIPGLGTSSGEENGNPLQYSCLENPMDGGAW